MCVRYGTHQVWTPTEPKHGNGPLFNATTRSFYLVMKQSQFNTDASISDGSVAHCRQTQIWFCCHLRPAVGALTGGWRAPHLTAVASSPARSRACLTAPPVPPVKMSHRWWCKCTLVQDNRTNVKAELFCFVNTHSIHPVFNTAFLLEM